MILEEPGEFVTNHGGPNRVRRGDVENEYPLPATAARTSIEAPRIAAMPLSMTYTRSSEDCRAVRAIESRRLIDAAASALP